MAEFQPWFEGTDLAIRYVGPVERSAADRNVNSQRCARLATYKWALSYLFAGVVVSVGLHVIGAALEAA